jgi:hypothetical protein
VATIDIKLSQYAVDNQPNNAIGVIFDGVERVTYAAAANYLVYASSKLSGSSLVFTYPDGATETYSGFVKNPPGANAGTATASGYELLLKDGVDVSYTGKLNLNYSTTSAGLGVDGPTQGSVINEVGFATMLPTSDPSYDASIGNVSMHVKGALNVGADYAVGGTISELSVTAENSLLSLTIDGNFQVSANLLTDGEQATRSVVTGTLTGYHQAYADGSHFDVSGASATLSAPYTVGTSLLGDPAYFGGNDTVSIDLPSRLPFIYQLASGAGDDQLSIKGGGGNLAVDAGDGNDRITLLGDSHEVSGGEGLDTVILPGARADYQVTQPTTSGAFVVISDPLGAQDRLMSVERIRFSDAAIALDVDGNGGQAYRLYQAAFARTPDKAGVGYWINALDSGASLFNVAQAFVDSDEFRAAYGVNPSNHDVVEKFYQNILHRAPDQAGLDYWVGVLDHKQGTVAQVLMAMSESGENKAGLIGVIGNGFDYTPYH